MERPTRAPLNWDESVKAVLAGEWYDTYHQSKQMSKLAESSNIEISTTDFLDIPATQRRMVHA